MKEMDDTKDSGYYSKQEPDNKKERRRFDKIPQYDERAKAVSRSIVKQQIIRILRACAGGMSANQIYTQLNAVMQCQYLDFIVVLDTMREEGDVLYDNGWYKIKPGFLAVLRQFFGF